MADIGNLAGIISNLPYVVYHGDKVATSVLSYAKIIVLFCVLGMVQSYMLLRVLVSSQIAEPDIVTCLSGYESRSLVSVVNDPAV